MVRLSLKWHAKGIAVFAHCRIGERADVDGHAKLVR